MTSDGTFVFHWYQYDLLPENMKLMNWKRKQLEGKATVYFIKPNLTKLYYYRKHNAYKKKDSEAHASK